MRPGSARLWLRAAAGTTVVVGLVAAAASSSHGARPWLSLFDLVDWPVDGGPDRFARETRAVNAVLGGVMVGWGTLLYLIATGPFARGDTTLAGPMLSSVAAWFAVDSTGSWLAGVPGNVVLNVAFLVLLVPPLLVLRHGGAATVAPPPAHEDEEEAIGLLRRPP